MSECKHEEYMWVVRSPYDGTDLCANCGAIRPHNHTWELSWHKDAYCTCGLRTGQTEAEAMLNENGTLKRENEWMRREVERVGRALFTGTETGHYVGTEEDLHSIGDFVEGVCETSTRLMNVEAENESYLRLDEEGYASLAVQLVDAETENAALKRENGGLSEGVQEIASQLDLDWRDARFILIGIKDIVDGLLTKENDDEA